MNLPSLSKLALLGLAVAPFAAFGATEQQARACVDTFVAEHLGGQQPASVHISRYEMPKPLALRQGSPLYLEAVSKVSGRTVAVAECSTRQGSVTVKAID